MASAYVELPSDFFNDLNEATVECWVQWKDFGSYCEAFGFGRGEEMLGMNYSGITQALQYFVYDWSGALHLVSVPNILRWEQWTHVAAVSGRSGMKLYLNGILIGENEYPGSFSQMGSGARNYLGGRHWENNTYFARMLDEVQIWNRARSRKDIERNMFDLFDRKTMRLWGRALLSRDGERLQRVSLGREVSRKRTPAVEAYARLRCPQLQTEGCKNYRQKLGQEIERIFEVHGARASSNHPGFTGR